MRFSALPAALALAAAFLTHATGAMAEFAGPPMLAERVAAGELPAVAERLPTTPWTIDFGENRVVGRYGGELRILRARAKDVRLMVVFGYARLVRYNEDLEIVPDIVERFEVEGERIFTFHLRPGHRWSDGQPFTSEDFRYFIEDVANDPELAPHGLDNRLLVDGAPPNVEFPDEVTVRFTWARPNPFFLPALAGASPLYIYRPAHYLRQFHARYNDADELQAMADEDGQRNWAALHNRRDRQYRNDNIEMPTLQPWINTTAAPSERFVFERNPYFHRVDPDGRQLPYIDRVIMSVVDGSIIPAKTGTGDADLQARNIRFDNFTFLRAGEEGNDFTVRLWRTAVGSHMALFPNLNVNDDGWRGLMRDARFRQALSLGIDRHEINQVVYFGLAVEGANVPLPGTPLARESYTSAWTDFDLARANALLDEVGLTARDDDGTRLMADGRRLELIVETAGESTEQADVLELVKDSWAALGIRLYTRPAQREVFRNRIFAGETLMSVWTGLENGIPTASMSPEELAPTNQYSLQWPKWGQYFQTGGEAGEPPDLPEAVRLLELNEAWRMAATVPERERIWHSMLRIWSEQAFTIGIIAGVLQPVVVSNRLRNVPEDGFYNWDPGAYFGVYMPDTFWFDGADADSADGTD